ncbi:MAG: diguanylate cyclase [Proteobacteria bacterium SG_bin9]|nr:MAG: diguanylate cyclase [Proteobacteria bacterium SG_bin9]
MLFASLTRRYPAAVIWAFVVLTTSCVLGLLFWKSLTSRDTDILRSEHDIRNLAHSLAQHADHTFRAPEAAMNGMTDLLRFQNPLTDRFNATLRQTVRSLPQIREMGVLNAEGDWRYTSLDRAPAHNNADRAYFKFHKENSDSALRITGPLISRSTARPTILLSKRITEANGNFGGVIFSSIDYDYFQNFYASFEIGSQGGISLISGNGTVLVRWPQTSEYGKNLADTELFQKRLKEKKADLYRVVSPFDGLVKYFGYEAAPAYSLVVTVARSEDEVLNAWRTDLKRDLIIAAALIALIAGLAWLLANQFALKMRLARRYRLLADNSADIVILLNRHGRLEYVSASVKALLGYSEAELIGRSCLDVVVAEDQQTIVEASTGLVDSDHSKSVEFRTYCRDGSIVWLEAHFKLTEDSLDQKNRMLVGVLRDITKRKELEDRLSAANDRLSLLATTDGLTGLSNRRQFDTFVRQAYETEQMLSVLMIDIDHFKKYNDSLGHQAGDACIQKIAEIINDSTIGTRGLSARYGGEEFAIVLPRVTEEQAWIVANAVKLKVRQLGMHHPGAPRGSVTVSIGVASKNEFTPDEVALIRNADIALYNAKKLGRNCVVASSTLAEKHIETSVASRG